MRTLAAVSLAALGALILASPAVAGPVIRSASGPNAAGIQATVDRFRADLGGALNPNNGVAAPNGRREINWDGVADGSSEPFPGNFFNGATSRGVVLSTPGTNLQVSLTAPVEFDDVNPTYSTAFGVFSTPKLFTPRGSTVTDVNFFVPTPSSTTPGTTSGFGAVFTDVDTADTTSIQFFDPNGTDLGTYVVAPKPSLADNASLSFLGVSFNAGERVARVRITSGTAPVGPLVNDMTQLGTEDVVAMDDFIYGEPQPAIALTTGALQVDETAGFAPITITRAPTNGTSSVTLTTADGTAQAGSDYSAVNTVVTFAANETSKTVPIPVGADAVAEKSENFAVSLSNPVGGALTGTRTALVTIDNITAAAPPTTPPTTPTPTTVVDRTPPGGGLVAVPTSLKLASLLKNGVKFQLLRNDRSTALAVLDGVVKKATLAATTFNLALVSKSLRAGTGRTTIVLKPPKALVGKPKKLTIRVRVILIDAAGNRRDLSKTISVKG